MSPPVAAGVREAHAAAAAAVAVGGYVRRRPLRRRCCESTNGIDTRPPPAHRARPADARRC
ncbi:hypothetical protein JYU34_010913 [Plutella xylostella]|uniref:Uncharacterized protein n=1 Tax=Plutella xylostella TaxID=51655 RepID=A0ABQ7QFK6_PLUXY|nr:hypothetical protein JYU34_010913 [Plutella xylostella]